MKKLVLAGALLAASTANANWIDDCCPMIGADINWSHIEGKDWDGIFSESFTGGDVYAGVKFQENFGINVGYEWTERKHHDFSIPNNSTDAGGIRNNTGATVTGTSKAEINGPYIDLMGYWCLTNCVDLFGSIGVAFLNANLDIAPNGALNTAYTQGLSAITGDDKAVLRIGVGIRGMVNNWFGVRAKVGWENTERLRLTDNRGNGFSTKPFKDRWMFGVGIFTKF